METINEGDEPLRSNNQMEHSGETVRNALKGIDKYLAMMNGRLEMLLMSDLPDYVMADLITIYQAEQEASQILRGLNIFCNKHLA